MRAEETSMRGRRALLMAGIGLLYKTIRHKNTTTRKKAAQLEYIMTQRRNASGARN